MIPTPPTVVHLVDALKGPLVGAGRRQRILPFVCTVAICLAVAIPAASWEHPQLAVAGCIGMAVMVLVGVAVPWEHR